VFARKRLNVTLYVHCLCCFTYSHPQVNLTSIYKVNLCTEHQDLSLLQTCDMYNQRIRLWVSSEIKSKLTALFSLVTQRYRTILWLDIAIVVIRLVVK
jgi:hypothetical protein